MFIYKYRNVNIKANCSNERQVHANYFASFHFHNTIHAKYYIVYNMETSSTFTIITSQLVSVLSVISVLSA